MFKRIILAIRAITVVVFLCAQVMPALAQTLEPTDTTVAAPAPETTTSTAESTMEPVSAEPAPDTTAPMFVSIMVVSAEETSANISWATDEDANGYVEYG